ncbi:MAG: PAS domain-containing protein [Chitinophagaceae bacterium]|nr:MAG: PAS domain-containing protein [Chitinophagaceae bacterium]
MYLYLHPSLVKLEGAWQWEASSEAVFCSDVIVSFPARFEGTRGILHPDDAGVVRATIETSGEGPFDLSFRMITTQGSVLALKGRALSINTADPEAALLSVEEHWQLQESRSADARLLRSLRQRALANDHAERQSGTGSWYYNASTHDAWYSDQVYGLHGLAPQSLNAHLLTFASYVHPIDAPVVDDSFDRAYQRRLPLDITYRIVAAGGQERVLRLCTHWVQNDRGEEVLSGLVQELTSQALLEQKLDRSADEAKTHAEALRAAERQGQIGSWHLNVLTGKWNFSDSYYRLLGLQPRSIEPGTVLLLQFVHPDDRELMADAYRRIAEEHVCPDLEYRVLRNDGQTRYFQLRGRALLLPSGELLLSGTVRDITLLRALDRRESRLRETLTHREELLRLSERIGSICTWTWDLQRNKMEWSGGCYELLGYKPNMLELSQKLLVSFLQPEDRKKFNDAVDTVRQTQGEAELQLLMQVKENTRYLHVQMRILSTGGNEYFVAVFRDETALRKQQEMVAAGERLLGLLGNLLPGKMLVTDEAHRIVRLNEASHKWMQGRGQAGIGRNLFEPLPRLKDPGFQERLNGALKGTAATQPSLLSAEAGSSHRLIPVVNEAGVTHAVLHLISDTASPGAGVVRQLAETLADAVQERVIVLDRRMNYLVWNRACELHYGRLRAEVLGRNLLETAPGFLDDPGYREFKRALQGETVLLGGESYPGHAATCLAPVHDESGTVMAVIWVSGAGGSASSPVAEVHPGQLSEPGFDAS